MEHIFSTPFGNFSLLPSTVSTEKLDGPVRAWDAADEYILNKTAEQDIIGDVLIFNDHRGGLSCPIFKTAGIKGTVYGITDSILSLKMIKENCRRNEMKSPVFLNPDYGDPESGERRSLTGGAVDLVLMKIPRSLRFFEYQLTGLAAGLSPGTQIIAGGMTKDLPASFFHLFSDYLEIPEYSRIKKRARLYTGMISEKKIPANTRYSLEYEVPEYGLKMVDLPGTYSLGKLDPGTRYLLEKLKPLTKNSSPPGFRILADSAINLKGRDIETRLLL